MERIATIWKFELRVGLRVGPLKMPQVGTHIRNLKNFFQARIREINTASCFGFDPSGNVKVSWIHIDDMDLNLKVQAHTSIVATRYDVKGLSTGPPIIPIYPGPKGGIFCPKKFDDFCPISRACLVEKPKFVRTRESASKKLYFSRCWCIITTLEISTWN